MECGAIIGVAGAYQQVIDVTTESGLASIPWVAVLAAPVVRGGSPGVNNAAGAAKKLDPDGATCRYSQGKTAKKNGSKEA